MSEVDPRVKAALSQYATHYAEYERLQKLYDEAHARARDLSTQLGHLRMSMEDATNELLMAATMVKGESSED